MHRPAPGAEVLARRTVKSSYQLSGISCQFACESQMTSWPCKLFQRLAKGQAVSVAVLDIEVAKAIGLITDLPRDLHALALEFLVQPVSILNPYINPYIDVVVCAIRVQRGVWP